MCVFGEGFKNECMEIIRYNKFESRFYMPEQEVITVSSSHLPVCPFARHIPAVPPRTSLLHEYCEVKCPGSNAGEFCCEFSSQRKEFIWEYFSVSKYLFLIKKSLNSELKGLVPLKKIFAKIKESHSSLRLWKRMHSSLLMNWGCANHLQWAFWQKSDHCRFIFRKSEFREKTLDYGVSPEMLYS